ncbi:MAG: hypothetical protein WCA17_09470 [Burkholderiales bacterium]
MNRFVRICLGALLASLAAPVAAAGDMKMNMPMPDAPAHFKVARAVYTTDHRYLVRLVSLPSPIPYQKYFALRFKVYEGRAPHGHLADARIGIEAGMRHGLKHGFAHGMDSAPKLAQQSGAVTVSGMYFHMMGPWVVKVTVNDGDKPSTAYFKLPCCGK